MSATDLQGSHSSCERCGTCCLKGGPALHQEDLPLIAEHRLAVSDLVTIRSGEPVFSPRVDCPEPSRQELIKIAGSSDSWRCRFYTSEESSCAIYGHRPLECRLLKCWDLSPLTEIIYKDSLSRKDVVPNDDSLWELIGLQEEHCGFARISQLSAELAEDNNQDILTAIARIISLDIRIRQRALEMRSLSVEEELLYFGRPMFKSLAFYHLSVTEGPLGLGIILAPSFGTER